MRILDAHQHFWDIEANYLPWLADRPIAFRYGNYDALKRNYLPSDYLADCSGLQIAGTVYVETEWDPDDARQEVAWVDELRAATGLPSVVVAHARLDKADVGDTLAVYGAHPRVRGIRHKPRAARAPTEVERAAPGSMGDPAWRRGYAALAEYGLSFDLQTPWWHLDEAVALVQDLPGTPIILNHTGLPSDRSADGLEGWRSAMRRLARLTDACVKISGLGQPGRPWLIDDNLPIIRETIEMFGVGRCMFASNFPVDRLVGSFSQIYEGFATAVADLPSADQAALFCGNAERVYRIGARRDD